MSSSFPYCGFHSGRSVCTTSQYVCARAVLDDLRQPFFPVSFADNHSVPPLTPCSHSLSTLSALGFCFRMKPPCLAWRLNTCTCVLRAALLLSEAECTFSSAHAPQPFCGLCSHPLLHYPAYLLYMYNLLYLSDFTSLNTIFIFLFHFVPTPLHVICL